MMKKKLVVLFMSALMVTSLTACGGDTPKQDEVKQESTQNEVADTDSTIEDAEEESGSGQELSDGDLRAITFEYFSYLQGEISEFELKNDMTIYDLNLEEAKEVYEKYGKEYGYGSYEPSEEILNPEADSMLQIGDVIVHFPITLGELVEQTGAVVTDLTEARQFDVGFVHRDNGSLESAPTSLDGVGQSETVILKTQDGSFLACDCRGEELTSISDLPVNGIETGSRSVFAPGGIRTGLDMKEMDELLDTVFPTEFSEWKYNSSGYNRGIKVYSKRTTYDSSLKMSIIIDLDTETNQVLHVSFWNLEE